MDGLADDLLRQAEEAARNVEPYHGTLIATLAALRARLEADGRTGDNTPMTPQWDRPAAIDLLPGDKVVVGGVERELIAVERGLRDGWVLLGWNPDGNSDVSSVWLADGTHVWRHLMSPLDERDTLNMVRYRPLSTERQV